MKELILETLDGVKGWCTSLGNFITEIKDADRRLATKKHEDELKFVKLEFALRLTREIQPWHSEMGTPDEAKKKLIDSLVFLEETLKSLEDNSLLEDKEDALLKIPSLEDLSATEMASIKSELNKTISTIDKLSSESK